MILVSVDGFFQFLPKLVEEKVSSRTEKTGKNHGKNHPLEETANPDIIYVPMPYKYKIMLIGRSCSTYTKSLN